MKVLEFLFKDEDGKLKMVECKFGFDSSSNTW